MIRHVLWTTVWMLGFAGCSSVPSAPSPAQLPWQDEAFAYDATLVSVTREELFRLDPELLEKLQAPVAQGWSPPKRVEHLLALLFGPQKRPFSYATGHSTVATETWKLQRGDCLSLTVLTYSMARSLNLVAQMQEVQVPVLFDRRGNFDFLSRHVNVLFRRGGASGLADGITRALDMVVDFEPEFGSFREGQALSDNAILARFYNNTAAEQLAQGHRSLAYAHFKAAILVEPTYAASYGNLALLYRDAGMLHGAEQLLRHAVALSDQADVPLRDLHQLLVNQGRDAEARQYAPLLQSRRDKDPYYWIELGLQHLQDGRLRQSISALERAQSMTNGFNEVHRYLAVAYWRAGDQIHANEQLTLLASLNEGDARISTLRKKINATPPPPPTGPGNGGDVVRSTQ